MRARRLVRQHLTRRASPDALVGVVGDTCGIHAQVQASAELQLAARLDGISRDDVRDALWRRRELVKSWTVRGTLHLHPSTELPYWYAARRAAIGGSRSESLKEWTDPNGVVHPPLGPEAVKEIRRAVLDALDGRCLLREELAADVVRRVGPEPKQRLLSGFAFLLDEICQGPPRGNKVTFVRPDQWIDGWADVDENEALRRVCRRYLRTHGPAGPSDFRDWFAVDPAAARTLFDSLAHELEEVDVEGHHALALAGDTRFPEPTPSVRLLPEYDVYVMGFREREHLVPAKVREQVARHGRGRYEGPAGVRFLLVDGVTAGLWERKKRGKRIELTVVPAVKLTRAQRAALDAEAERIGSFHGLEPALTIE